ncbi:MAG: hypothetical protein CMN30_05550 [Sandaracinus sp.]|mgnify:CR=1 FL=1|nr:hypothetical protein [Sandaracinus sp.]
MRFAVLAILLLSVSAPASAQRSIDVGRFRPTLDHEGFLGMQGTAVPGPWRWNVGLWGSYVKDPLAADGQEVIGHRLTTNLIAQLGIGGRFALALDIPFVLYQTTDAAPLRDGLGPLASQAMGDPRLVARLRVYGESFDVPRERTEGPGIALMAAVTAPAGTEDAFAGEGAATLETRAIGDFHILGAGAGLSLGWRHRFETRELADITFRDELLFGVGIKVPIPVVQDLLVFAEVRGALDARDPFGGGARSAIGGDLGVGIRRHGLSIRGGIGTDFTNGVGTAQVRAFLGMSWAPRLADLDRDSIPDDLDQCIHLPEDFDGFEDDDGCLDPDNDMDFIPDVDDRCPNEEALEGWDADEDGCTDPGAPTSRTDTPEPREPPPAAPVEVADEDPEDAAEEEAPPSDPAQPHEASTPEPTSTAAAAAEGQTDSNAAAVE